MYCISYNPVGRRVLGFGDRLCMQISTPPLTTTCMCRAWYLIFDHVLFRFISRVICFCWASCLAVSSYAMIDAASGCAGFYRDSCPYYDAHTSSCRTGSRNGCMGRGAASRATTRSTRTRATSPMLSISSSSRALRYAPLQHLPATQYAQTHTLVPGTALPGTRYLIA